MRIIDRAIGTYRTDKDPDFAKHVAPAVAALHRTCGQKIAFFSTDRQSKRSRVEQERILRSGQFRG